MIKRDNVYSIDDVWCPGCDQPLAKRNHGCQFCGWKDPLRLDGRVQPMKHYSRS